MGEMMLRVLAACGISAVLVLAVFILTRRWPHARLQEGTAVSIMGLAGLWLMYGLSKGRLDLVPLAYGGLGVALLANRQQPPNVTAYALNLWGGAGACLFLTIFAAFGATLDGAITKAMERGFVVAMYLWGIANMAALLRAGQQDGRLGVVVRKVLTPKMLLHIGAGIVLAVIAFVLMILAFIWMWVQVGSR